MNKLILTIFFLFISLSSFNQSPLVEAVYYDDLGTPYKIDRKYSNQNVITYITHDNQSSVCVQRQTSVSGDTTIIKEESFHIFNEKTKSEKLQDCETWTVSSNSTGDTLWLDGYKMEYSSDNLILVGDTMLIGEAAQNSWNFSERIKHERVPLILSGKMVINTDSLVLTETTTAYFLNDIPVRVEVSDSKNKRYSKSTGSFSKNQLIWKRYFSDKGNMPFQIDTISWNRDTTEIVWHSMRLDETKWNTYTRYKITGNRLDIIFSDSIKNEIQYLDGKSIFRNMLVGNFIYSDVLYYIELRLFDRQKTVSVETHLQTSNNEFKYDNQGKIVEQFSYFKGQLQKRVTYKYEN